eukprot:364746-Chlamydomonas_euryale.AAC.2
MRTSWRRRGAGRRPRPCPSTPNIAMPTPARRPRRAGGSMEGARAGGDAKQAGAPGLALARAPCTQSVECQPVEWRAGGAVGTALERVVVAVADALRTRRGGAVRVWGCRRAGRGKEGKHGKREVGVGPASPQTEPLIVG